MLKNNVELNIKSNIKKAIIFEAEMIEIINNFAKYFNIQKPITLDVTIVSPRKIKELNIEYRHRDYVTDILSFGWLEDHEDLYSNMPFVHMGELVICWDKVEKQAKKYGHSVRREFCYLFTHGLVHLKGYDHEEEDEREQMNKIVDDIFNPLNITREEI